MTISIVQPRNRPEHLVYFDSPESCSAPYLRLTGPDGSQLIAERDPSLPVYQVVLQPMSDGEQIPWEVEEVTDAEPCRGIDHAAADDRVDVRLAGSPFMTFHHSERYPKPVINPILTPGGVNMLREPMDAYSDGEHPWQRGLTLMQGAINGVDCWNERQKSGFGRTVQNDFQIHHRALSLTLASENTWFDGDSPLFTDSRCYRLFDTGRECAVLDVALTLKASHGPVTIGGTKEGGFLCIRVNPTMDAAENGQMRNVYGADDEAGCWSKASHWMDYSGPVGNEMAGFAVFDHPDNLRYPTTWHVRGYGLFAPNCWMFRESHNVAAGSELTFRWRVLIHAGDFQSADVASRYLAYVDGARIVNS